jgi:hypothetical protein
VLSTRPSSHLPIFLFFPSSRPPLFTSRVHSTSIHFTSYLFFPLCGTLASIPQQDVCRHSTKRLRTKTFGR